MAIAAVILFLLGIAAISAEQRTGINKSAIGLALAGILWGLAVQSGTGNIEEHLRFAGIETFEIIMFLASAMVLVEILAHYRFFDVLRAWLVRRQISDSTRLWVLSLFAFFCSAVIDNLTTTIIFVQLARLLYRGRNLVLAAALVVITANAGGAFSPIGDVTTTMLWIQGKFSSGQVFLYGFLPSLTMYVIAASMIIYRIKAWEDLEPENGTIELSRSDKTVVFIAFGSFALPFIFHELGLRPYLGLLTGLGITWILINVLKTRLPEQKSHFTASIEELLQRTDISVLMFFVGILLSVAALDQLGVLATISSRLFGTAPTFDNLALGAVLLGGVSAVVDNVPLTAAASQILTTNDPYIWVLVALAMGTGGSMLVIGSAAGIIAMSIVKDLTFTCYLKEAGLAALVSYIAGILVWYLQHIILEMF